MRGATQQSSTADHAAGRTPAQHAPPWEGPHTDTARPTVGGRQSPTQHALPWGGARTNAASPTKRGATHQHSTNPGQPNNTAPAGYLTANHSHPNTPTVRGRRRRQTNKTSGAWRRLNKRRGAPANTPPTRTERRQSPGGTYNNPTPAPPYQAQPPRRAVTNTARPTTRRATHQHSTPHHEGGPTTMQHAWP